MQKSKVLISGATGWLGQEILNIFSETNFEKVQINLIGSKNEHVMLNGKKIEVKSFKSYKSIESVDNYFDFAFLGRNKFEKIGPEKFKEINMEIISNSTNLIKRICPKTVILSSSGAIYNIKKSTKAGDLYSDLKKIQEELIVKACDASGSNLIISRIFNLSGRGIPRENNFALVDFMIKSIKNIDLVINSNYTVMRRYSDVTQLLRLLWEMADGGQNCVFDSGGAKIELRALADEIIKVVKSKSKVVASEINLDIEHDYYFSDSNSYENLLTKNLGEESITIRSQILNTRNSLFDINYGTI
jgi:nucleoside-diphosphate-sugar epimerase